MSNPGASKLGAELCSKETRMIRRLSVLAIVFFAAAFVAQAQLDTDKIELYGGYSFLHFSDNGSFNQNGWELQGQYKLFPFLGAVADFSGDYGNGVSTHYFLFGPEVSWPARVSPFAHVLIGAAHVGSNFVIGTQPPTFVSASDTRLRQRWEAASIRGSSTASTGGSFRRTGFTRRRSVATRTT